MGEVQRLPFDVALSPPFLVASFQAPLHCLSWSLTRPGFVTAREIAWLEVRNQDLPLGIDPAELLRARMGAAGLTGAVHLMTSRDIRRHHVASVCVGATRGSCLATVGLGNAGRVGVPPSGTPPFAGTINLLAHVDRPLTRPALIEALSMAAAARTAAIMDLGWRIDGGIATGTGTDCIVVAATMGDDELSYAGLHTEVGVALGRAVYDAVHEGGEAWIAERMAEVARTGEPLVPVLP